MSAPVPPSDPFDPFDPSTRATTAAPALAAGSQPLAQPRWWALTLARQAQAGHRLPWWLVDPQTAQPAQRAGSVARAHLAALRALPADLAAPLHIDDARGLTLTLHAAERTPYLAALNAWLRAQGLVRGWRDETYALQALAEDGGVGPLLATLERAAARFWGTLTYGAHANGWLADDADDADPLARPTHLWIARRALSKATDPGLLDNLIGGGVPHGQSADEAVRREGWEEAGLRPEQLRGLQRGSRLRIARDIPEGLQLEQLQVYDLRLPARWQPVNQDGEVMAWLRLTIADALACAADGRMTVDAALVTLDFALRHRLLADTEQQRLGATLDTLRWPAACGDAEPAPR